MITPKPAPKSTRTLSATTMSMTRYAPIAVPTHRAAPAGHVPSAKADAR